ncbi:uncharacterized protein C8A04DRAFT_14251 [Dichotomopilus funicola]|uniref:Rhodopsin domain-containing protein n=1 Tax=Dichotomopilus funicola TaxID=1934379 RepID=A0AAN6V0E9_9PEZI|nr:hypothetical protein C8A04DRAFT_14251 [Dichotomopilus funicola]
MDNFTLPLNFTPTTPLFHINDRVPYISLIHVSTTIPLLALTLVPFFARIYVRIWPEWRFGLDDGFIVAGLASAITDWALLARGLYFEPTDISWDETFYTVTLSYFAIPVWSLSMTLIKTSIVLSFLRLPLKRGWRIGLYTLIAILVSFGLANTLYSFLKCDPKPGAWDLHIPARCPGGRIDSIVSNLCSGANILTDLVLSVVPMFLLWNLRRPLRERILICSLTGIGLFVTVASVMKVVLIEEWSRSGLGDWALSLSIATWTVTEQFASILAACSPSLKKPIEGLFRRWGIQLVEENPEISFMYVPDEMRAEETRRMARERIGSQGLQIEGGSNEHHLNDVESVGDKSFSESASTPVRAQRPA